MADFKEQCRNIVVQKLNIFAEESGIESKIIPDSLVVEIPPEPELGDLGIPMFPFAKIFKSAPAVIAAKIAGMLQADDAARSVGDFAAVGPYVNVRLNKVTAASGILQKILEQKTVYGSLTDTGKAPLAGARVMVEFSSPNTNKPLHLGHLRNDALGESVSRILKTAGAEVFKVNIINNRGVHICKSMLAYQKFHAARGDTPESLGIKSDRFVGDCYVEFDKWNKEDPTAEKQAQDLLVQWEQGDDAVRKLWKQMNDWAIAGISQTYARTGVSFDKLYYESDTYLKGREPCI